MTLIAWLVLLSVVVFSAYLVRALFPPKFSETQNRWNTCVTKITPAWNGCNPIGQICFILLFSGSYVVAHVAAFPLLQVNGMHQHKTLGMVLASCCLATFFLASFSDPGRINDANVAAFMSLHSSDGLLFPEPPAICQTCNRVKPARSKHCNATKSCVAKYDHWCIWINNSVGFYNIRWFLAFIFSIMNTCAYVAFVCCSIILIDMDRVGAWDFVWIEPGTGKHVQVKDGWVIAARYIIAAYGPVAGLGLFCGLSGVIVVVFGAFQLHKFLRGETENERWKIKERQEEGYALTNNYKPFDQGWYRNMMEIAFPHHTLASQLSFSSKRHINHTLRKMRPSLKKFTD
jgi:hypothetical protein